MNRDSVSKQELAQTVESLLERCRFEAKRVLQEAPDSALARDLRIGVQALELIDAELRGLRVPRAKRSGMFTRYVVDEEECMEMNADLREALIAAEDAYRRLAIASSDRPIAE